MDSCDCNFQTFFEVLMLCIISCQVKKYFREIGVPADVKYIDPTYMIRACRANASDGILCTVLGQNAVSPLSAFWLFFWGGY